MVLEDNGSDDMPVLANGTFTFKTAVTATYSVTVKTQPASPTQTCTVTNGAGTATANITNVQINCGSSGLTLGGSVSGLIGSGLVLQNNGGDNFQVTGYGNVTFTFSVPITPAATYAVTVLTQPANPAQVCTVVNGTGTVSGNVANVQIICTQPGFTVGGSVVGLVEGNGDTLELQDNAGDDLFVTGDTVFTFATPVTNGGIYNVSMFLPPASQPQPCNLFNYTGIATANVSNVIVDCQHNDWNWISWYISNTSAANNYSAVTTPLIPVKALPPADLGTPGGRDFAATWTDKTVSGRKWLFGGLGFPYPSPYGKQVQGLLNDLWVYDPGEGWIPANLPTIIDKAGDWVVEPGPLEATNVASGGSPGSRWGSSSWSDTAGNLWLFGGQGYGSTPGQLDSVLLNDLWRCTPGASIDIHGAGTSSCPWTFVGGSTTGNQSGSYGTQGVAGAACGTSPCNVPGGRWAAATATDASGNFWLFGGQGMDSTGKIGLLNDLWEYNATANQWTWMGPSNSNLVNQNGNYGSQGAGTTATAPGGRQAGVLWVDTSNNVWLFGGFGLDSAGTGGPAGAILNDLWEFTGGQWVWVSGSKLANQTGTYGTQETNNLSPASPGSVPGSRWGAVGWSDANSNLWLFGGWGYGSVTTDPTGFLNDVWEYQQSTKGWIWWKGTSNVNQNGQYLTKGIPFVNNVVGARRGAAIWQPDPNGYVWIFGGEGFDSTQGAPPGYLDDLWTYLPFPN